MEECHCSNIAVMQLFHELKQQFPALPDYIVSQCIAQNSHDREICTRTLRATQESRPSPGAFPPPGPEPVPLRYDANIGTNEKSRIIQKPRGQKHTKAHRPMSLDIGITAKCTNESRSKIQPLLLPIISPPLRSTPSSAPAAYTTRGFFEELSDTTKATAADSLENCTTSAVENIDSTTTGFELNVNVACSPVGNHDFRTVQSPRLKRTDLIIEPRSSHQEPKLAVNNEFEHLDNTRSYTSVSLTLRPPSSESQPPIDIRSEGSSLTYSTSSLDPRGFQSRLQISIGPGNVGSVAAARIKSRMGHTKPNSIMSTVQNGPQRPPGLPVGAIGQLPRTTTMSAPTTPSSPIVAVSIPNSHSNPILMTPVSGSSPSTSSITINSPPCSSTQVTEPQRSLLTEQLKRKERLARELSAEKTKLETMKKELQALLRPLNPAVPPQEIKKKLRSEIYQLQIECDRLADEVDQRSDPRVPLGETNEEFYQGIYTGQSLNLPIFRSRLPPPLPSLPPAFEPQNPRFNESNDNRDDRDGPSWVCRMCTFDNHPLMDKCEQCDMPKFPVHNTGETQDIHIRVTHHHNFSPRRTVHSWVL